MLRQDVIFSARLATVAKASQILQQDAPVFFTMQLAQNVRLFLRQKFLCAAKYFHFRAFHITLYEIGSLRLRRVFVQGDGLHFNGIAPCFLSRFLRDVAQAAIWRRAGVRSRE